jgi:transcription-repair coupling factor (superfamily II helicase)
MFAGWSSFEDTAKAFAEGVVRLRVAGLAGSARALVVAGLLQRHPRPTLVVVPSLAEAHRWTQDLRFFGAAAAEFPDPEPRLWRGGHHREADAERATIARRLLDGEPLAVVVTPAGLDAQLLTPTAFRDRVVRVARGDRLDRELLLEALQGAGYERVETVVEVGQWSVRGGIVDVFSPASASPVRLELLGDDVESLRSFDPSTQRSVADLDELVVLPLTEAEDDGLRDAPDGARLLDYVPVSAPVVLTDPELDGEPREGAPSSRPLAEMRVPTTWSVSRPLVSSPNCELAVTPRSMMLGPMLTL